MKANKNDAADAEAICEAVARPNMRFVPINAGSTRLRATAPHVAPALGRGIARFRAVHPALVGVLRLERQSAAAPLAGARVHAGALFDRFEAFQDAYRAFGIGAFLLVLT